MYNKNLLHFSVKKLPKSHNCWITLSLVHKMFWAWIRQDCLVRHPGRLRLILIRS